MSDPTERVREILADIRDALAPSTTNQELLTEIRFLNQSLFGRTGAAPGVTPPNNLWSETFYDKYPTESVNRPLANLVRKGLMTETTGIFGDPVRPQYLAELIRHNFFDDDYSAFRNQINAITLYLQEMRSFAIDTPYDASTPISPGGILRLLWEILYLGSKPGANGGPLTGRELMAAIAVATRDAADCCEDGSGGEETAPAADPTACGEGFATGTVVSEYVPGDYSAPEAMQEGLALVPGSGSTFTDVAAPWAPSKRAFRVTGATSAFVCLQCTLAPGDTGQYGISIQGRLVDGSPAFTPGGFAQNFPPSGSYTSVLISEDSGGFDVYWFLTVYRVSGPGGGAESYSGPPARIFLTEGTLT